MTKPCPRCGGSGDLWLCERPNSGSQVVSYGDAQYLKNLGYTLVRTVECSLCGGFGIYDGS